MFLPPGIVPPVVQFMSPRWKSPPKNILAFLYLLSLLIFESDFSNSCIAHDIPSSYQYKIYRKDRKELIDKNDGGVLIMVRPDIKSDESSDLDTEYEIKWIEIIPNDKDQILIGSFNRFCQ
jgi:hypothetical protein